MSNDNWTPGPWSVGENHNQSKGAERVWSTDGSVLVADCGKDSKYSYGLKSANANLIAAAPGLYEALTDALCALEVCGRDFDYVIGKSRAALAKARGEHQ